MPLGKRQQRLGDLTKDDINFPKHLTPEIIHSALFIHNAHDKQEIVKELRTILKTYHYESDEQHISKDVVTSLENIIISLTS